MTGEINPAVARMFATMGAESLWEWPDKFAIETVTGQDGVTRQHVVNKRREPGEPLPLPLPVPTFEPAVPLPVLPPSDVETQAIKESSLTFDERYSPGAVAARVAAIEKEAAQMRASREQTE